MKSSPLLLAAALLLPAVAAAAQETPTVVTLKTKDGLSIEADWYRGDEGMPGVVGLHMYPADRTSWTEFAAARPRGWQFVAVDMRGYGGSATQDGKDLSGRVKDRDPELFRAMWQDALAAVEHLRREGKCDPKRIGLVGASVGCSVAFDAAARERTVAAVAVLSPGTNYLGVPTLDHLRAWPGLPVLLCAPKAEEAPVLELAAALDRHPWVEKHVFEGGRELHGTHALEKVGELQGFLWRWLESALAAEILDGEIDAVEGAPPAPTRGADLRPPGEPAATVRLRADRRWISVGVSASADLLPTFALTVSRKVTRGFEEVTEIQRFRGSASPTGSLAGAWMAEWTGERWQEATLRKRDDAALILGKVLEVRLPWSTFGVRPGMEVRVDFTPVKGRADWDAPPDPEGGTAVVVPE